MQVSQQALAYMLQSPGGSAVSHHDEVGEAFGGDLYDVYG